MQTLQQKAFVSGTAVQAKARASAKSVRAPVVVRAQKEEVCGNIDLRFRWDGYSGIAILAVIR